MKMSSFDLSEFKTFFRRHPERLGLEIDRSSLRIVRVLKRRDGSLGVAAFGELDIDLWHASTMEQQRFRSAIRQLGDGLLRVAVNIEHPSLRVRRMAFPKMPDQDLIEAIRWSFREQIEGAMEKFVVGFLPLPGTVEGNKLPVMAYGVSRDAIKEYLELARSLGLKVISLEPVSTALAGAFFANGILSDEKHHVAIAFGDIATQFVVMAGRSVLFSRPLAGISSDALKKLVMRNLNMNEQEAARSLESWIGSRDATAIERTMDESSDEASLIHRVEMTVGHFLSQLVVEVQRSIDAFCIMYGVDHIEDVYLCGPGVLYPNIAEHMWKTLGVATKVFNPFEVLLETRQQTREVIRRAPLFATAVGLAIS